jgi:hypothetical protein
MSAKNGQVKGTRDAGLDSGLIVARSPISYLDEILALPREESEAKLVEWARKQHDEAKERARAQIRRILESD